MRGNQAAMQIETAENLQFDVGDRAGIQRLTRLGRAVGFARIVHAGAERQQLRLRRIAGRHQQRPQYPERDHHGQHDHRGPAVVEGAVQQIAQGKGLPALIGHAGKGRDALVQALRV